jgi:hypothetical protein
MPKRKNGGGEYKKVKGSSGSSSPKNKALQEKGSPVGPSVPFSTSMPYAPRVLESTPLQPRHIHFDYEQQMAKPDTVPFRNTDIERLKELGKRLGAAGASVVSQPSQRIADPELREYFLKHGKLPD